MKGKMARHHIVEIPTPNPSSDTEEIEQPLLGTRPGLGAFQWCCQGTVRQTLKGLRLT